MAGGMTVSSLRGISCAPHHTTVTVVRGCAVIASCVCVVWMCRVRACVVLRVASRYQSVEALDAIERGGQSRYAAVSSAIQPVVGR